MGSAGALGRAGSQGARRCRESQARTLLCGASSWWLWCQVGEFCYRQVGVAARGQSLFLCVPSQWCQEPGICLHTALFPSPHTAIHLPVPENIARTVASLFSYSACGSCSLISSPLICSSSGAGLFTWPSDWSFGPSCTCSWRMVPRSWSGHSIPLLKTPQRPHDFPSKALAPLCGR